MSTFDATVLFDRCLIIGHQGSGKQLLHVKNCSPPKLSEREHTHDR